MRDAAWFRAYRATPKGRAATAATRTRYRFGPNAVAHRDEQLLSQLGRCAVCASVMTGPCDAAQDHNHTTGALRGLLCVQCNFALERHENVPAFAEKVAAYLDRWVSKG